MSQAICITFSATRIRFLITKATGPVEIFEETDLRLEIKSRERRLPLSSVLPLPSHKLTQMLLLPSRLPMNCPLTQWLSLPQNLRLPLALLLTLVLPLPDGGVASLARSEEQIILPVLNWLLCKEAELEGAGRPRPRPPHHHCRR